MGKYPEPDEFIARPPILLFKNHFNIIFPSTPKFYKSCPSLGSSLYELLPHECYIIRPPHPSGYIKEPLTSDATDCDYLALGVHPLY